MITAKAVPRKLKIENLEWKMEKDYGESATKHQAKILVFCCLQQLSK